MKKTPTPGKKTLTIRAYFDFVCPWSYLGRARLRRALHRVGAHRFHVEWVPFELYTHEGNHLVSREKIWGHEHLAQTYAQLHELGAHENMVILHPNYEGSSRRALTGFLFAQQKGEEEKYMNVVYEHVFEHTANISSLSVLERIAIKMGWNPHEFRAFVENPRNQEKISLLSAHGRAEGVRGIPTYFVNRLPVTGALPVNDLVSILHTLTQESLPAELIATTPPQSTQKKRPSFPKKSKKSRKSTKKRGSR